MSGICKICGCTENNACNHPDFGPCFWLNNETQDLCSHCVEFADQPDCVEKLQPHKRAANLKKLQLCQSATK